MLTPEEIIGKLKPCHYKYNDIKNLGDKIHYGFIAQDLIDAFGEEYAFVRKDQNSQYYMVSYNEFIAPIVSVLKNQQTEIAILKQEIENLKEGK